MSFLECTYAALPIQYINMPKEARTKTNSTVRKDTWDTTSRDNFISIRSPPGSRKNRGLVDFVIPNLRFTPPWTFE